MVDMLGWLSGTGSMVTMSEWLDAKAPTSKVHQARQDERERMVGTAMVLEEMTEKSNKASIVYYWMKLLIISPTP